MLSGEQQLGRYHLLRRIARGGMGEIYLAEDPSIKRQVAIKIVRSEPGISPGGTDASEGARLFQREARAIAQLDHPHILPLYDYGEEQRDGTRLTYLVMPYRPEGSLANWLQQRDANNPFVLEDLAHLLNQAAEALQYTHDHGIIHQDVKPSNFLLRANTTYPHRPDVLISDFGVARLNTLTSSSSQNVRGTPGYMSPEQWAGHPTPASDQYALAVMAYELLTGRPPFQGNPMQMMYAHVNTPAQAPSSLNPNLPAALDAVILRGLAKRPEDRFPTIAAFNLSLQQILRGSAAQLRAPDPYDATLANSSSIPSRPVTPASAYLSATLAISEAEARNGTNRVLTLPGGRKISVSLPPGVQNGQVIDLDDTSAPTIGGDSPQIVRLTLSLLPTPPIDEGAIFSTSAPTAMDDGSTFVRSPEKNAPAFVLNAQNSPAMPPTNWQNAPAHPTPTAPPLYATPVPQPPSMATPEREKRSSRTILVISGIVVLLLILGSTVLIYAAQSRNPGNPGSGGGSPTSAATSNQVNGAATSTAQANASSTAQSQTQANANATATAQAQANANATTQAQANATATVAAANPYGGTLIMHDPLADNSQGHQWQASSSCQFTNGAYHMTMPGNYGGACLGTGTHFVNFAFQVQMTFFQVGQHFSGGGLVFRGDAATSQYYVLHIYESGQYEFNSCSGNDCSHGIAGYPGPAAIPSFHLGLNQTNTIAVVAKNDTFTFYANSQEFAGPISDPTYTQGMIGFYAEGGSEGGAGATVDVAYTNAEVWQL